MYCYAEKEDSERYQGKYESIAAAVAAAVGDDLDDFYIGDCEAPPQPEDLWSAEDWLEHVDCYEDYSHEWAEDWDASTEQQKQELEAEVRKVMAAWLDRHDLRPKFWNVGSTQRWRVIDGVPQRVQLNGDIIF